MRETLVLVLDTMDGITLCAVAESAETALELIPEHRPDLVLLDLSLPGMSGTDLIRNFTEKSWKPVFLVLSGHDEVMYAQEALNAGARGYVMKGDPVEVEKAIREVLSGSLYLSESMRKKFER